MGGVGRVCERENERGMARCGISYVVKWCRVYSHCERDRVGKDERSSIRSQAYNIVTTTNHKYKR